ncbi:MAG: outer membrane beta-barrel protein [Usitatibacter sp.]
MALKRSLVALAFAILPAIASAADYFGMLKLPESSLIRNGPYLFSSPANPFDIPSFAAEKSVRLKLGYKYSRHFAIESEYVDFSRNTSSVFASPGNFASQFRSTGFGVDAVAILPVWRFSFYGRMGAYRGDARGGFGLSSTALLPADQMARGSRLRYGVGVRYDFNKALGIRAELERNAPLGSMLASEAEVADQITVGLSWRF